MRTSFGRWILASTLLVAVASCDHPSSSSARPPNCPACECKCACADPATPGASDDSREAVADLTELIGRKIAKRDGSCLGDVDQLEKLDPRTTRWAKMYRAECSMLAGKCEAGKSLMRTYYRDNADMLPEQIERTVESVASLYCTGPLDDRGELLRALATLQKGAYQGNIGIRACTDSFATVVKFRDRVKPIDDEDSQVASAKTHSHHTAAACLGRAGDCNGAFDVYATGERNQDWARRVTDKQMLERLLRDNFRSTVPKCKQSRP